MAPFRYLADPMLLLGRETMRTVWRLPVMVSTKTVLAVMVREGRQGRELDTVWRTQRSTTTPEKMSTTESFMALAEVKSLARKSGEFGVSGRQGTAAQNLSPVG